MSAALTGASFPLRFVERVDNERKEIIFRARPLADIDLSELDTWIQTRYIRMARLAARDLPFEERQLEVDLAQRHAATLSAFSGPGARMIATVEGMAQLCYQMIYRNHPEITIDRLKLLMINPENVREANEIFKEANINNAVNKSAKPKTGDNLKKTRRRTK